MDWTGALVAAIAAAGYGTVAWVVGDRFPFSRYSMYADLRGRDRGSVPFVRFEGRDVAVETLDRFSGVTGAAFDLTGVPCSQEWIVWENRRWIDAHQGDPGDGAGVVEVGFRHFRIRGATVEREDETRATGRARRVG
jgi:hypothetical protein